MTMWFCRLQRRRTGLSTGLTNNHDWATVRKFGSVDFTLHATNNLRFHFNYYRPSDEGTTFTTRSLDFLAHRVIGERLRGRIRIISTRRFRTTRTGLPAGSITR